MVNSTESHIEALTELHTAFWNRELEEPIINVDCPDWQRTSYIPAIPQQWADQNGLVLDPRKLSPEELQPAPYDLGKEPNAVGEVAFNTLFPYWRIPWVAGIIGCDLKVSAAAQTVWPDAYLGDDWHLLPSQGFSPRLEWLDALLEFVRFTVEQYFPDQCIPTLDQTARGPGDLILHVLTAERLYYGFYDHPEAVRALLDQITDYYIHWAQAQLDAIPRFHGGYCNQYGIWSPGTCIRTQEDYAMTMSRQMYEEFIMPADCRVADAFEYQVYHTHSGFPDLAEWVLDIGPLKCVEVGVDPHGPPLEELIPLWNRVLEKKCLIVMGPFTKDQLDMLVSSLAPGGLCLDVAIVTEEELPTAWEWDRSRRSG
jgi:hypothetical protein